jgi:tRNA1Val (adenine37-N6)-methyltransferase
MSNKPFHFKEFTIHQDKTAMKVGTDGVLLGAWVIFNENSKNILDIGTGTGLIALQLAQRSSFNKVDIEIDALEIEPNAYEQAVENFENSDWRNRLFCYHTSLQEFLNEFDEKYDLIISNPPYYTDTYKHIEKNRALARHNQSLSFKALLSATVKLLSKKGSCAFIIPFKEEEDFLEIASQNKLFPQRITRVKGNVNTDFKRSLIQLSFDRSEAEIDELAIEIERHIYTEKYKDLVKEFYLKL